MTEITDEPKEIVLPEDERLLGQNAIIIVTLFDTLLAGTALGSVSSLFVLKLGKGLPDSQSAFHVALLSVVGQIAPLSQVLGLGLLTRAGKARLVMTGHIIAAAPLLFIALLAGLGVEGNAAVFAMLASMAVYSLIFTVGQTAWWPLIQDSTAGGPVEPFFARMRTRYLLLGVVVAIAMAFFMGKDPSSWRFTVTYIVGALALVAGGLSLRGVSERPYHAPDGLLQRLRQAALVPSVRKYVAFAAVRGMVLAVSTPFWVVILKRHGLPEGFIVWLSAVVAIGNVTGVRWWGRFVSRHNFRPAITITLVGESLLGLAWLLFPGQGSGLRIWAVAFYLLWGMLEGGYLMGWTRAMLSSVPGSVQANGFTLATVVCSTAGALAGLAGGFIFQRLTDASIVGLSGWAIYLCLAQLLFLAAWRMASRMESYENQAPAARLMGEAWMRATRPLVRMMGKIGLPP